MNGKRYLLDTNAVIQLLAGNPSLRKMVEDSDFLAISVSGNRMESRHLGGASTTRRPPSYFAKSGGRVTRPA